MVLAHLTQWNTSETIRHILSVYEKKWYCVVHFLYFANVMKQRLLEKESPLHNKEYEAALLEADVLCIDGIALQIFTKIIQKKRHPNLNWTDLTPRLMEYTQKKKKLHMYVYWWPSSVLKRVVWIRNNMWYTICHAQHGYDLQYKDGFRDFVRDGFSTEPDACNLFLLCLGSPLQELFVKKHMDKIKKYNLCVMTVWWYFEFVSWEETRAPAILRDIRVAETFWRIATNPKKNLKKFWWMFGIVRYWWYIVVHHISKKQRGKR